ncbi:MAG TPA: regulatory protein RecX [Actinomycetes bacterium]|nr:regulatory protein RecX [Actinomycetes bacterium]
MARPASDPPPESLALIDPEGSEDDADPVEVAKQILLTQLTASAKSRHQLAQVLAKRAVPQAAAEEALDRFTALGYIDDAAFAAAWVDSRRRSRGLAASALRRELRDKGIDAELVDRVLAESADPDAERDAARRLVDKKLRSMRGVDPETATRRLVGMLGRKGYRPGVAYEVVKQALAAASEPIS